MKFATRITALSLSLALCLTPALAAGVEDKFPAINEYPGYADVPAGIWYEKNAQLCYEVGLMTGTDTGFQPARNMQVSEVAVIAARILEAVTGEAIVRVSPKPGENLPWYFSEAEYLKRHGISLPESMTTDATRADFLTLLAAVTPDELLVPINTITKLPDSTDTNALKLYNAGILTGVDKYGTLNALSPLSRSEGAAMVSRVVRETLRQRFVPADYAPFTAAGCAPGDLFFEGEGKPVSADGYLTAVLAAIADLESACKTAGIDFNWNNTVESGGTFLTYVKENSLSLLGVTKDMGTALYQNFDLQVFYSRYLDLTGLTA